MKKKANPPKEIIDICEDHIVWSSDIITLEMQKQMDLLCKEFGLTVDHWEGNNDIPWVRCYFHPPIPEEQADDFWIFCKHI